LIRSRLFGVALVFTFAALFLAAGASAATVRVAITGSVQVTADPPGGDPSIGISLSGVVGDLTYAGIGTSTGSVTQTYPSAPIAPGATGPGASLTVFHGDVSQGCVRVQGNRSFVVGHLPSSEQFDIPSFGHIEWAGALLEDNGDATGTPVDRARALFFRASTFNGCNPASPLPSAPLTTLDSGDVGFGYADLLDAYPSNPDTVVSVTQPNGLGVTITDAPDPQGMSVAVAAGSGFAKLNSCGKQVKVNAGSMAILTCASLITEVVTGSAEVVLEDGLSSVLIPEGGKAEITDDGNGGFTVENLGTVDITVVVDGVEGTIEPGETDTLEAWDFQGFFGPVDNPTVLNKVKAGVAVPLKWRILNALNAPVTNLSTASITVTTLDCESGETVDQVEETAAGGSGLQNLGGGYYQLNWKTPKSYGKSWKTMQLDIGDGVTHDAFFEFTK